MTIKSDQHGFEVQAARPALSQNITIGAGNVQSAPFSVATAPAGSYNTDGTPVTTPNHTLHVRLIATADCWIAFGTSPVATQGGSPSIFMPANIPEYFWVFPGERVAVTQTTAGGFLNIGELVA